MASNCTGAHKGKIGLLAALGLFVISGSGASSDEVSGDVPKGAVGVVEMSSDQSLLLRMFEAPKGADVQTIKPSDRDYKAQIEEVGGLRPGERKFVYASAGEVSMNADHTIRYIMGAAGDGGHVYAIEGVSKPGDSNYRELLSRVGGLKPGETKQLPFK